MLLAEPALLAISRPFQRASIAVLGLCSDARSRGGSHDRRRRSAAPTLEIGVSRRAFLPVQPEAVAGRSLKRIHARGSILTGCPDRPDVRVMYDSLPRRISGWHTGWIRAGRDLRRFFAPHRRHGKSSDWREKQE